MGAVEVVVAEVVDQVALSGGELRDERAGERGSPAFFEDRELEPFDVSVRGRPSRPDPPLLDYELAEAVGELMRAAPARSRSGRSAGRPISRVPAQR